MSADHEDGRGSQDPQRQHPQRKDKGRRPQGEPLNPAGPHAAPHLTDHDKTPGTGALPGKMRRGQKEADPGSG